jgi:hypothetical protein
MFEGKKYQGIKFVQIKRLFISLESFWSVDIENDCAFSIEHFISLGSSQNIDIENDHAFSIWC